MCEFTLASPIACIALAFQCIPAHIASLYFQNCCEYLLPHLSFYNNLACYYKLYCLCTQTHIAKTLQAHVREMVDVFTTKFANTRFHLITRKNMQDPITNFGNCERIHVKHKQHEMPSICKDFICAPTIISKTNY